MFGLLIGFPMGALLYRAWDDRDYPLLAIWQAALGLMLPAALILRHLNII